MDYQLINLNDYFQTGEGGTALTYNNKNGRTLAKLFTPGYGAESAEHEFLISKAVYEAGIPCPRPIRLVTDGERFGGEYEVIAGKRSFTRIISQEPEQLEPLSIRFARLARELHQKPADTGRLPDMRKLVRYHISRFEGLPQDLKDRLLVRLDSIPASAVCLHGDLHIGNIITDGTRDLWIDVGDFAYGCPEWDLGMMYYADHFMSEERAQSIFHVGMDTLKKHWALFAREYWSGEPAAEIAAHEKTLYPFIALKITFLVSKLHDGKGSVSEPLLNMINACLR